MGKWMAVRRTGFALGLASVVFSVAPSAGAGANDPVVAKMASCEPAMLATSTIPNGGFGNDAASRQLYVRFGLEVTDVGDDPAAAITNTHRIEICTYDGANATCPGDGPWLVYDAAKQVNILEPKKFPLGGVSTNPGTTPAAYAATVPIDPGDPAQASIVAFVRINGGKGAPIVDIMSGGFCKNWQRLAESGADGRFDVYGVVKDPNPFGFLFDPCTDGSKIQWTGGNGALTPPLPSGCITQDQAGYARLMFRSIDDAQASRIQGKLAVIGVPQDVQTAWPNGTKPGGGSFPTHVLLGAHSAWGQAGDGAFHLNIQGGIQAVDPTLSPAANGNAVKDLIRLGAHEYFHQLQGAWGRAFPASSAHINGPLESESTAESQEYNLCLTGFPGDPTNPCVSAGKVPGANWAGVYGAANQMLARPEVDILTQDYDTAVFWRYVQEQFSHPTGTLAHPAGIDSAIPWQPGPLGPRKSDEGIDFLGLLFEEEKNTPSGASTQDAIDVALQKHLGRSLGDVIFDLHTALYLKDYNDTDDRWRLEWVGDYAAATPLAKPFDVPNAVYDMGPDQLVRAHRTLDDWQQCPKGGGCTKLPVTLWWPDGVSSSVPVGLGHWGATLLSVHPDASWADPSVNPGKTVAVHAQVLSGAPLPRFRVFTIEQGLPSGGTTPRTPKPVCGSAPMHECALTQVQGVYGLDVAVPLTSATDEVLVLASARDNPATFTWSIGPTDAKVSILEPTASLPAYIGHPTASDGRRSALVKFTVHDANAHPLPLVKSQLHVSIPDCAKGPGACDLTENDFTFLPLSGGNYFVVLDVPNDFYDPAVPKRTYALHIAVDGVATGADQANSLAADAAPQSVTSVLVLDTSGSMGDFGGTKLQAAKIAAKAIVESLVPPPGGFDPTGRIALVTFADDATTQFGLTSVSGGNAGFIEGAIDTLTSGGWTSIGDGVLEAQSLLGQAFDPPPGATAVRCRRGRR